ncbi:MULTISPECIES: hypothetical protein [unclassified Moorena]|uniref:hypothetical protein n=1 Tax=unclassified Moorena TaxID=2683338 RepID=UPI0013FFEB9C|nr:MULTISPECIES: hypothetical protein [unclassified Moorena]NEO12011.1 hypothetical protein [Moorena sp. SIO3E8]NEQ01767.1 hypothetical protein [Moorena sp. SIO3F7]
MTKWLLDAVPHGFEAVWGSKLGRQPRENHASELLGVTPKTSLHRSSLIRSSLFPTPDSRLPTPDSLLPKT